ncbi:UNVERIFIED_ORG: AcrR family transcriptional regulator [Rhizobium sp. SORGH_AS260]|nr:AcrR family transcriptional regulator [Rhizobium sp. SORGH_AS_0285]MDP9756978.1 AcrR family transcriptional regulator [Rhizobium sp. SORGH_AS_0260]MDR6083773.1 AcrR family transcriptional regulator [Agrobacterium sp. SORGH_AS_0440]
MTCMLERRISPFIKGVVLAVIKKNIRKPRAGSERNRQRLMEFAKAAFAEKGTSASLDDIAHAAGFGVGTLYRHFPTREVLTGQLYEKGSLRAFAVEFHDLLPHPEIEKSISVPKLALQYAMATGVHFHVVVSRTQ